MKKRKKKKKQKGARKYSVHQQFPISTFGRVPSSTEIGLRDQNDVIKLRFFVIFSNQVKVGNFYRDRLPNPPSHCLYRNNKLRGCSKTVSKCYITRVSKYGKPSSYFSEQSKEFRQNQGISANLIQRHEITHSTDLINFAFQICRKKKGSLGIIWDISSRYETATRRLEGFAVARASCQRVLSATGSNGF